MADSSGRSGENTINVKPPIARAISSPQMENPQNGQNDNGEAALANGYSDRSILRQKAVNSSNSSIDCEEARNHVEELNRRRSASVMEVKENASSRIKEELTKAQQELRLKDEECQKLLRIQEMMNEEVEELTAKLFEEANKMVQDAHVRRMHIEKLLKEANSKIEVLQAEVTALKTLVLTSTPSTPNPHLNPQIVQEKKSNSPMSFIKGHRRSTSHHNFTKEMKTVEVNITKPPIQPLAGDREIDEVFYAEFKRWRESKPKSVDKECQFLNRIVEEDIKPCLSFTNQELSESCFEKVLTNSLIVEPWPEKSMVPRECGLTKAIRVCKFRIRLEDSEPWIVISQLARNRLTAVCDFFTYIRYIVQGLVKSEDMDVYWELIRLRKLMCLARLGITS